MSGNDEKEDLEDDSEEWVVIPNMPDVPPYLNDYSVQIYLNTLAFLHCLFETIHQPELARRTGYFEECPESILEIGRYFPKFPSIGSDGFNLIRKIVLCLIRRLINEDLYGTNSPNTSLQDTVFNPNTPKPSFNDKVLEWVFGLFPKKVPKLTNDEKIQKLCQMIVDYYMRKFYIGLKRTPSRWCGEGDKLIH